MQDRETQTAEGTNLFVRLMKKLSGQKTVVPASEHRVVRREPRSLSIVEVTEELLRQTGK
ncbi:MAG TPA: hypothetical protein VJ698_12115 [Noviherbaspirillum sp.]|uniref:hypothetical protein n=1 Tax=Noviherbaspirillum sp. TaxID=1926288 RepID=UPI002B47C231|nr:hypothetical protein [Noviherbaspirillum sp.]HJV86209.1 hypothetical protein [Noviherbaspirillum sp.]